MAKRKPNRHYSTPVSSEPSSASSKEEARHLVAEAMNAANEGKTKSLLQKALKVDPHCTEAMCIMSALSDNEASSEYWLRRAIKNTESVFLEPLLPEQESYWDVEESRPNFLAKGQLAVLMLAIGRRGAAIDLMLDLAEKDPADHIGIRYPLIGELLNDWRDAEAWEIYHRYRKDSEAFWDYARFLLEVRDLFKREPWDPGNFVKEWETASGSPKLQERMAKRLAPPPGGEELLVWLEKGLEKNGLMAIHLLFPHMIPSEDEVAVPEEDEMEFHDEEDEANAHSKYLADAWWEAPEQNFWATPFILNVLQENGYGETLEQMPPPPVDEEDED